MSARAVAALIAVLAATAPMQARADMVGGDLPLLTGILTQTVQMVTTANDALNTARRSYDELQQFVGYAEDAADAYREFAAWQQTLSQGGLHTLLEDAFPALGALRQDAAQVAGGDWTRPDGSLRRYVRVCLTTGQCAQAEEALSMRDTQALLTDVFGPAPTDVRELAAADHEAALALAQASAQEGRGAAAREYAKALLERCRVTGSRGDAQSLAACQAAAAAAEISRLEADADLADAVSQGNRLAALQLALEAQERKRELLQAEERRALLVEGAKALSQPPPRLETDGFDVLQELR